MINILSHIVEFRNGESGLHVLHIQTITEMLLRQLVQKENNRYALSKEQIRMITTASALHDIGKISIPDEILNKPGRLTAEEFAVIKGHSMAGANMLSRRRSLLSRLHTRSAAGIMSATMGADTRMD